MAALIPGEKKIGCFSQITMKGYSRDHQCCHLQADGAFQKVQSGAHQQVLRLSGIEPLELKKNDLAFSSSYTSKNIRCSSP